LGGGQEEHPHPRLALIYYLIQDRLDVPRKVSHKTFTEIWSELKKSRVVKLWDKDDEAWQAFKREKTSEWLEAALMKLAPPAPRDAGVAVEIDHVAGVGGSSAALAAVASIDVPTADVQSGADASAAASAQVALVPLSPPYVDVDLKLLESWFAQFRSKPRPPSEHARLLTELRSKAGDQLQTIDPAKLIALDHMAFLHTVQLELANLQEKKALCRACCGPGGTHANSKRGPAEQALETAAIAAIAWAADMEKYEEQVADFLRDFPTQAPSRTLQANSVFQGRVRYLSLLSELAACCKNVRQNYANALKVRKSGVKRRSLDECGVYAELLANPLTVDLSYEDVIENLNSVEAGDGEILPGIYGARELVGLTDLFLINPVLTLEQIFRLQPPRDEHLANSHDLLLEQVLRELPVVAVRSHYATARSSSSAHTECIWRSALSGSAFAHFLHLLEAAGCGYDGRKTLKDALVVVNDADAVSAYEAWQHKRGGDHSLDAAGSSPAANPAGRPKLTDERAYGPDLATFVQNYTHSRGQVSQEGHRRKVSGDCFGASLADIAAAVERKFGKRPSKTGVRNLTPKKKRHDATNTTLRGEVDICTCRVVKCEKIPHEHAAYSAANVKYMRQLLTLFASRGIACREFSVDQLRKYPFWIAATSGASPHGWMAPREDGLPALTVLDHDVAIGPHMLLTTSGVQERVVSTDAAVYDQDKPQLQVSSDGKMTVFLRPHRYLEQSKSRGHKPNGRVTRPRGPCGARGGSGRSQF